MKERLPRQIPRSCGLPYMRRFCQALTAPFDNLLTNLQIIGFGAPKCLQILKEAVGEK